MVSLEDQANEDFLAANLISKMIHRWWVILLFIVAGGVVGCLVSFLVKPVFESNAEITTVIDFAYAGRLTDYEEDHLLNEIGDVILSDEVIHSVSEEAIARGWVASAQELREKLSASRQGYRWVLSVYSPDPEMAQLLNQIWLESSVNALSTIREDSYRAIAELNAQAGIESCFEQSVLVDPVSPYCDATQLNKIQQQITSLNLKESDPSLLSRVILSRISFQVTREPTLPISPVRLHRNLTTLAGSIAGLLVALMLFISGFPVRKHGKG